MGATNLLLATAPWSAGRREDMVIGGIGAWLILWSMGPSSKKGPSVSAVEPSRGVTYELLNSPYRVGVGSSS